MKYMTIKLIPKSPKEFIITHFLGPYDERLLSKDYGERVLAVGKCLEHAQDLIEAAYDIKFQTREWDIRNGEEEN